MSSNFCPAITPEYLARLAVHCENEGCAWRGMASEAHCPPEEVVTCPHCGAPAIKDNPED